MFKRNSPNTNEASTGRVRENPLIKKKKKKKKKNKHRMRKRNSRDKKKKKRNA